LPSTDKQFPSTAAERNNMHANSQTSHAFPSTVTALRSTDIYPRSIQHDDAEFGQPAIASTLVSAKAARMGVRSASLPRPNGPRETPASR